MEEVKKDITVETEETESVVSKEEMEEAKKTGTVDFSAKKEEKEKSGTYVHKFKTPVEIMGKKYTSLTFYFDRLCGEDIEAIEDELMDQNKFILTPETSTAFQCILAAKAAGIASDEIRRLPVRDYMKIKNKARIFLLSAD